MNKTQDTKKWQATITVDLTAINGYGDKIGGGCLIYKIHVDGSLPEIVGKLDTLKS